MTIYVGIDPGTEKSAFCVADHLYRPRICGILENHYLKLETPLFFHRYFSVYPDEPQLLIEKPICRKWAGSDVSETAIWAGIFYGRWPEAADLPIFHHRQEIKAHWGKQGNDHVIRDSLIERFDPENFKSIKHKAYGHKKKNDCLVRTYRAGDHKYYMDMGSDFFKGFEKDIWQAYALIVYHIDKERGK